MTSSRLFALLLALLFLSPFAPGLPPFWFTLSANIGLAALVALGLVLLTGVGGMTSFGQAAFCGFGAYASAALSTHDGLSPWLGLPAALVAAGAPAIVLGLITVRLSGHYLPIGTIAWGLSLYYLFGETESLGGHDGISAIPPLSLAGLSTADPRVAHALIWAVVLLAALATRNLLDSRVGRAVRALRRGQIAAESFGVDVPSAKLLVFVYAAVLAGLSGWLYAHVERTVTQAPFGLDSGIEYLFMAVVGGAGQIWGALVGAALVTGLKEGFQRLIPQALGGGALDGVLFGIILVVLLQNAREGLWPRVARLLPAEVKRPPAQAEPLPARTPSASTKPLLAVERLRKQFGGLVAVNDVEFTVKRGEIVALIGPNGAGKSTTFNLITGVAHPTAGGVRIDGAPVDDLTQQGMARRGVARTFQHVKLNPDMSVLENVAIGAHLRGRAGAVAAMLRLDRAEEARLLAEAARQIARVGLDEHMLKPAGSLALGQQRLVEIARALALDPCLLLLDEPAAGLRHFEKEALAGLLRKLRAEGMSVLLVEHDMGFVMGLTDHIVVLDFGAKIAEGPPEKIKTDPAVLEAYLGGAA